VEIIRQSDPSAATEYLARIINSKLEMGQNVLWLVAGGSAIKIAALVSKKLRKPLKNLTVALTDERYGPVGYKDSNWQQLLKAGFRLDGASLQPVLRGKSLSQTAKEYSTVLRTGLKAADYSLALAGMGPDGHIFGIKPGSPAVVGGEDVLGYQWDDYIRITPTIKLIKQLDEVAVYAVGREKWPQFDLLKEDVSADKQPAQLLKQLKKVIIFTDYKGDIK
jgi:6-phosphogluconolactonase/glucosamine-6-phosphate isomerase/deaminase